MVDDDKQAQRILRAMVFFDYRQGMTSDGYRRLGYLLRVTNIMAMIGLARQMFFSITGDAVWPVSILVSHAAAEDGSLSAGFSRWLIGVAGWGTITICFGFLMLAVIEICDRRAWPGRERSLASSGL